MAVIILKEMNKSRVLYYLAFRLRKRYINLNNWTLLNIEINRLMWVTKSLKVENINIIK